MGETIQNRRDWGDWVESAIEEYEDRAAEALAEMAPESRKHWQKTLSACETALNEANDRLEEAEMALARERADDRALRERRDAAVDKLRDELASIRSLLDGLGGRATVERFSLAGPTPQVPDRLEGYTKTVLTSLREVDETIEGPTTGMTLDTTELADELAPLYDELVESLEEISADERKKDALLVQRDEALEQWKETYRGVASMVDGAFRLVG